jgi:hypothetical protein
MPARRTLEIRGKAVLIRFPFDPEIRDACRGAGARWSPESRCWTIPVSASNELVETLRNKFEFEVDI